MKKLLLISLLILVEQSFCDKNDKNLNQNQNSVFCTDLKPQSYMDEDMVCFLSDFTVIKVYALELLLYFDKMKMIDKFSTLIHAMRNH